MHFLFHYLTSLSQKYSNCSLLISNAITNALGVYILKFKPLLDWSGLTDGMAWVGRLGREGRGLRKGLSWRVLYGGRKGEREGEHR